MEKILTETGIKFRPQLGEPIKRLAKKTMRRHAKLNTETKAVRYLVTKGYEAEFGEPCPADVLALIESEQKG